jgi:hypothetical protein
MHRRACCDALSPVGIELAARAAVLRHRSATSASVFCAKWTESTASHEELTFMS